MSRNTIFYILISIVVSALLLWVLLARLETGDFNQTLSNIYYPALLVYMAIALLGAVLRSWRYKWLLQPEPITWRDIFLVTLIRNLFVDLLPSRVGSLSYIYLLNRRLRFSFESATSTFVVAFLFDFITLGPFLILSILAVGFRATSMPLTTFLLLSVFFFGLMVLILWKLVDIFAVAEKFGRALFKALKWEEKKWTGLILEKIQSTRKHLLRIQKRKIFFPLFFLSFVIRAAKYGALYALLYSLLRFHGITLRSLSVWKTILGTTGAELTSVLPVKGIAGFGTWESAWTLTFQLMNVDSRLAILSGIGVHLLTNLFEYSLGILAILVLALLLLKKTKTSTPA